MSTSIQDCASIAAEERRARRKQMNEFEIDFVEPVYFEHVSRNRVVAALFLGLLFRLIVLLKWTDHVALSVAAIFFSYEMLSLPQKSLKYPKHGYAVNFLLVGGLNERLVIGIGLFLDLLWDFFVDLTIISLAFSAAQLAENICNSAIPIF